MANSILSIIRLISKSGIGNSTKTNSKSGWTTQEVA